MPELEMTVLPMLLYLPPPELLPHSSQALADMLDRDALEAVRGPSPASFSGLEIDEHGGRDKHIHLVRVVKNPVVIFVSGFLNAHLNAYRSVVRAPATQLGEDDLRELFAGLCHFVDFACRHSARRPAHDEISAWPGSGSPGPGADQRWLIGHQLHSVLLQGIIVGLNCFLTARALTDRREADASLRLATAMARSSAAAMRFTGDSVPPPPPRPGFVGLQTRDRAFLIRRLRNLRSMFGESDNLAGGTLNGLFAAVVDAYATHELIQAGA